MCGIAGLTGDGAIELAQAVEAMCDSIRHRGPDDDGLYCSPDAQCVLGNRRLAIMDLSAAGHMPMRSDDGRYWITYNGEIYNFGALRAELEARGHRFHSRTDTEVVLRLFAEEGPRSVERLNGMFAIAIWDQQERTLFLARDRMGIKPLYYAWSAGRLLFASEVRAILASGLVEHRVDGGAMAGFLVLGSIPDTATIVSGVRPLPPAHWATVRNGVMEAHQYWHHTEEMARAPKLPEGEVEEAVREGLKETVARQVVSDAPLGLFLSGGMDSGTLAALMRAIGHREIRSVSIALTDVAFDESKRAAYVARRFGLNHTSYPITASDVASELDDIVRAMDQPSTDGVNTYFVSRAARESGLTVALSGLGADELFGGYPSFTYVGRVQALLQLLHGVPGSTSLLRAVDLLPYIPYRARKLAQWANGTSSLETAYATVRGLMGPRDASALTGVSTFDPEAYIRETVGNRSGLSIPEAVSILETRIYMHNQLLRDTDAMSMAHSLEVRVPYLDNEMIALAAQSRATLLFGDKRTLAGARSIYFPRGIRPQPKQGFSFPFQEWILGPLADRIRSSTAALPILDRRRVDRIWSDFAQGRRHWSSVWTPFVLAEWLQHYRLGA